MKNKLLEWNIFTLIVMKVTHGLVNENKLSKDRKSIDVSERKGMDGEINH
jgi:hypothetical protein